MFVMQWEVALRKNNEYLYYSKVMIEIPPYYYLQFRFIFSNPGLFFGVENFQRLWFIFCSQNLP